MIIMNVLEKRKKIDRAFYNVLRFVGVLFILASLLNMYAYFAYEQIDFAAVFASVAFMLISIPFFISERIGNKYNELKKTSTFRSFQLGMFLGIAMLYFCWFIGSLVYELVSRWDEAIEFLWAIVAMILFPFFWVSDKASDIGTVPLLLIIIIFLLYRVLKNQEIRQ